MRTAEEAIAAFAEWDGTAEYPPGSNRNWITEWYGMGPVAWCAMACSRALIEGGFGTADRIDVPGVNTTSAKGWAYCPYVEADFRAAGRWHDTDPEPGDLVLYDWDGDEWSDHIGLLASVEDDMTLYVWEGNTDEGVVRLKHRSRTYVRGFARPPYLAVVDPPKPDPQPVGDPHMLTFRYIFDGLDWVFDGPSRLFFQCDDTDQITQVLDKIGVPALGQVSPATHNRYAQIAQTAGFTG